MLPVYRRQAFRPLAKGTAVLLRSNDAAQRVAAWEHDAAMVDFRLGRGCALDSRIDGAIGDSSAAGRTPVDLVVSGEHGVALGADALHQL